jgi:hypothetical protein
MIIYMVTEHQVDSQGNHIRDIIGEMAFIDRREAELMAKEFEKLHKGAHYYVAEILVQEDKK